MTAFFRRVYNRFLPFYQKITRDNIFAIAAQTAFFLILSAVPFVMFLMSLLQGIKISPDFLTVLIGNEQIEKTIKPFLDSLTQMYDQSVTVSIITLIATLWSASKGIHAITNGLNRVHNTYENRNWLVIRLRSMLHTFVFLMIIIVTVVIIFLGSLLNNLVKPYFENLPGYLQIIYNLRYVIVFLYQVFLFALLYREIPNLSREQRKKYPLRCQLPGALFCATSWHVLLFAIAIYVTDFNGFSIYKGLTQLAIVMVFLYFCMICLMIGAEINAFYHKEIDRHTRKFSIRYHIEAHRVKKAMKKQPPKGQ